jgi:hypothetical protein
MRSLILITSTFLMTIALHKPALGSGSDQDYKHLTLAREAFAEKDFKKALSLYDKVSKKSEYWALSREEKAWAHLRLNETAEVLASTRTLLSPPLNQLGLYEAYIIQSLTELRTCRYEDAFKTLSSFKKHKLHRIKKLEDLAEGKTSQEVAETLMKSEKIGFLRIELPDLVHLDHTVFSLIQKNSSSAPQSSIPSLEKITILAKRLQVLAQTELEEIKKVVTKLKLIEVEAEQRVVRDAQDGFKTEKSGAFKKTDYNKMIFPADDNPWIDELDQFEVAMQVCKKHRRKL